MVKVTSDGPVRTKKTVCGNCSYELEFTGEDVICGNEWSYIYCPRESCRSANRNRPYCVLVRWP